MTLKVALVLDWLVTYAGAERVVEQIIRLYPQLEIFALVDFLEGTQRNFLQGRPVRTSFIQKLPKAKSSYRSYLPVMPLAIEQFDVSAYDVVISSSHAVAKGVITGPDQIHICYCHSPIRYAWDLQHQYLKESGLSRGFKSLLARWILHKVRLWDYRTANGVDVFIANSSYIARRIKKVYGREAELVFPPVAVQDFDARQDKEDFYLAASRMVPYKKMEVIVEAFRRFPEKRLIVIGEGPQYERIKALAGANVSLLGYQPFDVLRDHMQRARAFVFAAEEDFGIIPVEAQACGTPVIAFRRGGAVETVIEGKTGVFFDEQTPEAIAAAVTDFEALPQLNSAVIRANAERFSQQEFDRRFVEIVNAALVKHRENSTSAPW